MADNYDLIFNSRINIDWDENKIDELGRKITDLSGKVDLTKFDENQQKELQQYGISSISDLFVENNGMFQFSNTIKQLGSNIIPSIVREIQTFGRALTDITRAEKTYSAQMEADSKTATAYRTLINSGSLLKDISGMKFSSKNVESLYSDTLRLVSKRFDQMSHQDNQSYSREMWTDILSEDSRLRRQVSKIAKVRNVQIDEDKDITELIRHSVIGLGSRSQIDNRRSLFAPLYEHKEQQYDPTDIFGNKHLSALYKKDGELQGERYVKASQEAELQYSKGIYAAIRKLQQNGNRIAQDLAVETGLASYSEMTQNEIGNSKTGHDQGLVLRWNKAPEGDRIRKFLGRTMQEARKIRSGQDIYQRDPDLNRNISKQFEEILEITQAFSDRATGKDGEEFSKRFIESAGTNIDLSSLSAPTFGKVITKIQDTAGRIPTYGVPYTTVSRKGDQLVFEPRTQEDMQKVVKSTGQLKTKKTDKGILLEESQLTHLSGINKNGNNPNSPIIVSMPISDMWERDEEGFLKSGKEKKLTKEGEMQKEGISNGIMYNGEKYRYVYTNGESATFMREKEYLGKIAEAKRKGLDNPFEGYDPTINGLEVLTRNKDTGEWESDLSKSNKMIISAKRIATQGRALKDIVGEAKQDKIENMKYGAVSLNAQRWINEQLGAETVGRLVDGAGFIDPSLAPFSFQARGLGMGFKGVLGNYDWRDFLRKTVKQSPNMKKSPFIQFDQNGELSKLYMPSVAFQHLEEQDKQDVIKKLNNPRSGKKTREQLLNEYFQDVMDPTLGALLFDEQLKTPSQMTVKSAEDYVNFITGERTTETDDEWNTKVADAQARLKAKRSKAKGTQTMSYVGADGKEYIRLNKEETAKNIAESMKFGEGPFAVKSAEDFSTGKRTIGQQVAEAIGFSPEMKRRSAQLFAEQLDKMETDDYWINEEQFSQRADIRNLLEQAEDKSAFLRDNKQAREYIQSQKDALRKKSMTHYMLDNSTSTELAFPFLGSFWGDILSLTGAAINEDSDLAWMYPQMLQNRDFLKNKFKLSDRALDKITEIENRDALEKFGFNEDELAGIRTIDDLKTAINKKGKVINNADLDEIRKNEKINIEQLMFSEDSDRLWALAGRTPSAINTFSRMLNLAAAPKSASQAGVRGGGNLRLVSPEGIYRMNTGDFDGDTIMMYAYANEQMFKDLEKINKTAVIDEATQKEIDSLFEQQMAELKKKKIEPTMGGRVSEELYNFMSGQGEMGKASAIMRNALDLYDLNTEKGRRDFMRAYNLGSSAYDKATSEGQNMGWVGNYTHGYSNAAYLAGRQFSRFQKDVSDDYTRPYSDKEFESHQSIFKNRLLSLNNLKGLASALEAGKLRQGFGIDFGFGDMVDDWIANKYGRSSKGYNQTLFDVASDWGDILKGQYDLSHLVSNKDLESFFRTSIAKLTAEAATKEKGSDERTRLDAEINNLKRSETKMLKSSGARLLTTDNLDDMIAMSPENSEERSFYERVKRVNALMPKTEQIIADDEHQALIEGELEKHRAARERGSSRSADTVEGLFEYWDDLFKKKNPSVTAKEPYFRDTPALAVRKTKYDENGVLINKGSANIIGNLWSPKFQKAGIAADIASAQGLPTPTDLDTVFGSFVHDVFSSTILDDTKNGRYDDQDFLKKAKEVWDTGGFVSGNEKILWKDVFTGAYDNQKLSNPLSEEDWTKISEWLKDPTQELQELSTLDPGVRQKLLGTFTGKGNNSSYFLRDLFNSGHLFEAENEYIDPTTGKIIPSRSRVPEPSDKTGRTETSYRPDLIWETNDGWLDMYDWKPNEEGAGKSIYQMIHYAETARIAAMEAKRKQNNGETLTSDDERWLKYLDSNGNFRMRNLVGKDYTGRGDDVTFEYNNPANAAAISAVMGGFATAGELYKADRENKTSSPLRGFQLLFDAGIIKKDEKISSAMSKYFMNETTYGDIEDSIKAYRSNPENIAKASDGNGVFSGSEFIRTHGDEWNYLVAKQAKNRESLDSIIGNIRGLGSKYNTRAATDREYSSFDFIYDDIQKLKDPELIAALSSVYKDVLPYAIQDIGQYEDERIAQEKFLRNIVDIASVQDPVQAERAMRRRLYHSQGSNVFDDVERVIGQANRAAGTRQTYKKPYDDVFFNNVVISRDKADSVWAEAGKVQQNLDAQNGNYTTEEGKKAKQEYDNFVASLNARYDFERKGVNTAAFMTDAGRYTSAQPYIDQLRETEAQLISQIYEDDRKQTENTVASLTGKIKTPEDLAQIAIDKQRSKITDYIASSKIDMQEADTNINQLVNSLTSEDAIKNKSNILNAATSGDISKLNALAENATKEDSGVFGQIKNLMLKKETLQNAIDTLNDYLGEGFEEFSTMTKEETKRNFEKNKQSNVLKASSYNELLGKTSSADVQKYSQQVRASEVMRGAEETRDKLSSMSNLTPYEQQQLQFLKEFTSDENRAANEQWLENYFSQQDQLKQQSLGIQIGDIWRNSVIQKNHQDFALEQFSRKHSLMGRSRSRAYQSYSRRIAEREALELKQSDLGYKITGEEAILKNLESQYNNATTQKEKDSLTPKIEASRAKLAGFNKELETTQKQISIIGGNGKNAFGAAFDSISQSVTMIATRFGRQMFYKAINEVKSFVKEYDKAMTEIQMITLKSDTEITHLGEKLINVAKNTGSTVTEVTSAASNLYRQGLSDEEVDERLDDVIKFSKVTGIKTTEASKIITTALQNGLVGNSEEAMDALTALGDSAATTASEIAKGMQKSAAAAKQAGMSYGELVTLLTIGTSKTQLGGSSIGSSLNTLIYRLYKVNNGEDFTDENGRHIASTAATKALSKIGVDIWDEEGNFRGPYQILQDIASKWEDADDTTQSMILTTLGAGRQRSNVATLLQGMAQDNGELAQKYLDTAEGSKGITDRKYDEYLDSLQAKLNGVKTSFDGLIESLNVSGSADSFLSFITDTISGLTKAEKASKSFSKALLVIGAALTGILVVSNPLLALVGGISAIALLAAASYGYNTQQEDTTEEDYKKYQKQNKELESRTKTTEEKIKKTRELAEKAFSSEGLKSTERSELKNNLEELGKSFGDVSINIESLINNYDLLMNKMDDYENKIKKDKSDNLSSWIDTEINYGTPIQNAEESAETAVKSGKIKSYINKQMGQTVNYFSDEQKKLMEENPLLGFTDLSRDSGDTTYTGLLEWLGPLAEELYKQGKIALPEDFTNREYVTESDNPAKMFSDLIMKSTSETGFTRKQRAIAQRMLYQVMDSSEDSFLTDFDVNESGLNTYANMFASEVDSTMQLESSYIESLEESFKNRVKNNPNYKEDPNKAIKEELNYFKGMTYIDGEFNKFRLEDYIGNGVSDEVYTKIAYQTHKDEIDQIIDKQIEKEQSELSPTMTKAYFDQYGNKIPTTDVMRDLEDYVFQYANTKEAAEDFDKLFFDSEKDNYNEYYKQYGTENLPEWVDNWVSRGQEASSPIYGIRKNGRLYITQNEEDYELAKNEALESLGYVIGLIYNIAEGFSTEYPDSEFVPSDVMPNLINEYFSYRRQELKHNRKFLQEHGISLSEEDYKTAKEEETENTPISKFQDAIDVGVSAYETANEKTVEADKMLNQIDENGIAKFSNFVNLVNDDTIKDFSTLLQAFPELAKILDNIVKKNPKTGKYELQEGLEGSTEDSMLMNALIAYLTQRSSDQHRYETNEEIYANALQFKTGGVQDTDQLYENAYKTIVGEKLANKRYLYNQAVEQGNKADIEKYKLSSFEEQYEQTLLDNYNNGIIGLTTEDRLSGLEQIMQHINPENGIDKDWLNSIDSSVLEAFTSNYKDLINDIVNGNPEVAAKAWEKLNKEFSKAKLENLNKYDDAASQIVSTITALKKGGKEAAQTMGNLRKESMKLSNAAFAISKGRGKKPKELGQNQISDLVAITGDDPAKIKEMTKEQFDDYLNQVQNSIDEDYTNDFVKPLQQRLAELAESNPVEFAAAIKPEMVVDGQLDASEVTEILTALKDESFAAMAAEAGSIGTYTVEIMKSGLSAWAIGQATKGSVTGTGKRTGGGGGGGGKSKADKLIEEQKRKMAVLEHENKLLQTEEKRLDYQNDYEEQNENVQEQIDLQYRMKQAYTENIQELQTMMNKTKADTDDWYKLRDAIYAAEEALKEIANTINEISSKRINILDQKFENQDKPGERMINMLEKYADRAMSEDRLQDYLRFSQQRITETQATRSLNVSQIEEWKKELANFEKDTDGWIEVRDKIWELEQENAELDNELVQMQLDLNSQRLSQISKVLQQNTQTATHNQNIASTYSTAYESGGYRQRYEEMIREQQKANEEIIAENKNAEASVKDQMAILTEGSTAWFEAQAAMYSYSEAVAQAEVSQMELNRALAQSQIDKIIDDYGDATRELTHVNELISNQAKEYLDTRDYDAYFAAMQRYMENLPILADEASAKLSNLNEIYTEGMASKTLDPAMQRALLDAINEAESEYQNLMLEQAEKQREVNKVTLDKLFEDQDWAQSEFDHNIKLVGYENSRYQNNGELTNVNTMIEADTKLRQDRIVALGEEIKELEKQHKLFEDGSEEEKRIVEQIKKHEEAIESENTQIDKNNKLLDENRKKIMQVRKTLEDAVDKEIEAEKKLQREILAANVNMQNTVVDLLRKRLQDEWNLKKKDIDKEKESLNEYKKLINDRLNYRKKAMQQADKQEEIADLNKQIALLSADPTRSKDLKEMTRKRDELLKEQSLTIAEDEVAAESERIDDQIEGMDKFVQYNEELLNEILGDANNFSAEMNEIISGSFEESYEKILEFMSKENEAFMKSLPDAQKQMIQGWEDTWKKANDIIDSNFQLITNILGNKDTYMEYMRGIDRTYRLYQENGDQNSINLLERQWSEYYDNYVDSIKDTAEFDEHTHNLGDVVSKINELEDNVFKVNIVDIYGDIGGPYGLDASGVKTIDFSNGQDMILEDLDGIYKVIEQIEELNASSTDNGNGTPANKGKKKYVGVYVGDNESGMTKIYETENEAILAAMEAQKGARGAVAMPVAVSDVEEANKIIAENNKILKERAKQQEEERKKKTTSANAWATWGEPVYAKGGLVDFTGHAWVDGTKTHPESFLDATDTALLRSMLDTFDKISVKPGIVPDSAMFTDNSTNVGDINITINQAELKSDDDYAKVARRVGQEFSKELKRSGLNLSGYSFS